MMVFANQKVQYWWVPQTHQCATNVDCRLANWQVNKVNIVVKCSNRFPIPKPSKRFVLRKGNLVEHFTTMFTLLTCKSAVCICRKVILKQNCLTSQGEQRANFLTFSLNFREGHVAVAEKLILHGADVELPDNYGQSPLFMACWKGRI